MSLGQSAFELGFVISPIVLTNGIAQNAPAGMVPIVSLLNGPGFFGDANINNAISLGVDAIRAGTGDWFAYFDIPGGATLINNQYGMYPFANQRVAANAVIVQPSAVSLIMHCPWKNAGDAWIKTAIMAGLKTSLDQHTNLGGTYTVVTPSYTYTNQLLVSLRDVSAPGAGDTQRQTTWEWAFTGPLLTLKDAEAAQNSLMQKIGPNGTPVTGDPASASGPQTAVGNPFSGQGPASAPSSSALPGAGVSSGGIADTL